MNYTGQEGGGMKGFQILLLALAFLALTYALVFSPGFVAENLSGDAVLESNTITEIQVFRIAAALIAGGILIGLALWKFSAETAWERLVVRQFSAWRDPIRNLSLRNKRFLVVAVSLLWLMVAAVVATIFLSFKYFDSPWFAVLAFENGVWETAQFAFLLGGGCFLLAVGVSAWRGRHWSEGIGGVLFAILILMAAGEEVSWGQNWADFATPDVLKAINVQGEFNLHNIGGYWADHLAAFMMFHFIVLWPVLGYLFPQIHFFMFRLSLPVAPLALAPIALIGFLMDEHPVLAWIWGFPPWRLSEGREAIHTACIFVSCMLLYRLHRHGAIYGERDE